MAQTIVDQNQAIGGLGGGGGGSACESPSSDGPNCSDTNGDVVHGILPNNNMCSSFALSQCSVEQDCGSSKEYGDAAAVSADNSDMSACESSQDHYAMQPYTFTGKFWKELIGNGVLTKSSG